jgi:hypothetical protein
MVLSGHGASKQVIHQDIHTLNKLFGWSKQAASYSFRLLNKIFGWSKQAASYSFRFLNKIFGWMKSVCDSSRYSFTNETSYLDKQTK